MSGDDIWVRRALCGWDRSWVSCTLSTQPIEAACRVTYDAAQPTTSVPSIRLGILFGKFSVRKTSQGENYSNRTTWQKWCYRRTEQLF